MKNENPLIRLWVPFPPSLNKLYPGKARRHKSKEYEAWIKEAGLILNRQKKQSIKGEIQVTYRIGKPNKRRMDLANREKCLSDLLVSHGIIEDDSFISRLTMEWADLVGVEILIEPFKTAAS